MKRAFAAAVGFILLTASLTGCFLNPAANQKEGTAQDLQRLARIEVYSAKDGALLHAIEDTEGLLAYSKWDDWEDCGTQAPPSAPDSEELYSIVTYRTPAAVFNDGALEKSVVLTLYQNTNTIKLQISPENVKSFSISEEYLTDYCTVSDEKLQFLLSLADAKATA